MRDRQRNVREGPERVGIGAALGGQPQPAPAEKQVFTMSPAVERDALVPAPAGQQHPHPPLRRAALHRFLVHLDVHPGEGAVATQDGEHVAGAQRPVEHPQPLLPAYRVDQAVFRRVLRGGRRLAKRRQPTERGWRRAPPAAQLAGREHRDARRVQPPAQVHAHRSAAQAVPHRPDVESQELLCILVVGSRPRRGRALGTPPALDVHPGRREGRSRERWTAPGDPGRSSGIRSCPGWVGPWPSSFEGEAMAGRQLAHLLEERAGGRVPAGARQVRRHGGLVQRAGDPRHGEDGFDGAGEDEPPRGRAIVERPHAGVVAGAEQRALPRIPHREGVVAEQVVRAVPAPARPGPEDEAAVGEGGTLRVGNAERAAQRVAVVEAGVRGHRDARAAFEAGRAPGAGFVRSRRVPAAEADGAFRPPRAGLAVVGQCGQHGVQPVRGARFVQMESADRLHPQHPCRGRRKRSG